MTAPTIPELVAWLRHEANQWEESERYAATADALERLMELEAVTEVQDTLGGGMLHQIAAMQDELERLERENERLRKLVIDADSHISWCRHRHGHVSKDPETREHQERMLDEWIRAARTQEESDVD